jgi:hypothetical protein
MPLPVIADTYRVALNWTNTQDTTHATNVIHIKKSGSSPAAIITQLEAAATADLWKMVSPGASVDNIVVTPLDGSSISVFHSTGKPAKWTGNGAAGDWIPQVSSLIKLTTSKRGRSYRGRIFLPFTSEGTVAYGIFNSTYVGVCTTAWTTWLTAMTAAGFTPCVASYLHSTEETIVAIACEGTSATQRRRQHR